MDRLFTLKWLSTSWRAKIKALLISHFPKHPKRPTPLKNVIQVSRSSTSKSFRWSDEDALRSAFSHQVISRSSPSPSHPNVIVTPKKVNPHLLRSMALCHLRTVRSHRSANNICRLPRIPPIIDRLHLRYSHFLLVPCRTLNQVCSCLRDDLFHPLFLLDHASASPAYHLLDHNNERRLIIRCGMTITNYHISKLFDLVPNMEECSALSLNNFNERMRSILWILCERFSTNDFRSFHCPLQIVSIRYLCTWETACISISWRWNALCSILRWKVRRSLCVNQTELNFDPNRIVNDLVAQSQHGKYGDTSGIGQLIHQVRWSNVVFCLSG